MSRVTLVTGGGRNIGKAIALSFAAAGDDLVLAARTVADLEATAEEAASYGVETHIVQTDVTDPESITSMVASALDRFGAIDVAVSNSGIGGPSGPLWEIDVDEWRETLTVNTTGSFLLFRAVLPQMIERGSGALVAIASITGKRPLWGRTAYATSKSALTGLVRSLAVEAGPHGIRVNLISPGWVEGPRMEWVMARQAERRGIPLEHVQQEFAGDSPMDRMTQPSEVADACVYLASEAASGITGADLNVNAGVVMY